MFELFHRLFGLDPFGDELKGISHMVPDVEIGCKISDTVGLRQRSHAFLRHTGEDGVLAENAEELSLPVQDRDVGERGVEHPVHDLFDRR